jgi:hypothetical protein
MILDVRRIFLRLRKIAGTAAAAALLACAPVPVLVGTVHPPLPPADVQILLEPPTRPYEPIAVLTASSKYGFAFSAQRKDDIVMQRLKEQAARLGANGVLLEEIANDPDASSIASWVGTAYTGSRGNLDLGIGTSLASPRFGRGTAIYLVPQANSITR